MGNQHVIDTAQIAWRSARSVKKKWWCKEPTCIPSSRRFVSRDKFAIHTSGVFSTQVFKVFFGASQLFGQDFLAFGVRIDGVLSEISCRNAIRE